MITFTIRDDNSVEEEPSMIDMTKLTPATTGPYEFRYSQMSPEDFKLYCLARSALDVLMRRPWGVECILWGYKQRKFKAVDECDEPIGGTRADDPFTALVKADAWYKTNVESPKAKRK